ncbi:MAG: lysophospholipid acyltransferase family protein [Chlamydiales bacterium]|nr:lysophospholipid acyltransferase family protein [Chlamydiales bacterium]
MNTKIYFHTPLDLTQGNGYVFISNHQSLFDLPLIFSSLNGTLRVLAKKELFKIPLFGSALKKAECISIDRGNTNAIKNSLISFKEKLKSGISFLIFAEGTRSHTGELLPLKPGAFRLAIESDARIVPVAIVGTKEILPAKTSNLTKNCTAFIHFGNPIDTTCYRSFDAIKILMTEVEHAIKAMMQETKKRAYDDTSSL